MPKTTFDFSTYLSPFTWRYGSPQMRSIWSEENKRKLWRKIWVELATAQHKKGLLTKKELDDLIKHQTTVDIERAHEIEREIHHDLMAEIKTYAEQSPTGGGKLHLGATSMDIEDNADALREKESLDLLEIKLKNLLQTFSEKINQYKDVPCMGYTHLQPAEPTTIGYRFAFYTQDLLMDLKLLRFAKHSQKGKGLKGAVGTSASYTQLMENASEVEQEVMKKLGMDAFTITSQTAPRKQEQLIISVLSSIAASLYKLAFDIRILQSPAFGELSEPFGKKQVGSSAMPFKRNPWKSEQICSLARYIIHLSNLPADNAAHMLLERTLDDSANRRVFIPELFLATDEILSSANTIMSDVVIHDHAIKKNLTRYGMFCATESILMEAVKQGADRQKLHEILRTHALKAYDAIQKTGKNPLPQLMENDSYITRYIPKKDLGKLLDPTTHIGNAPQACTTFLKQLKHELSN